MDAQTLGAAIALMKTLGSSNAAKAIEAAKIAASHNFGVSVSGTTLIFTPNT